MSQPQKPPRLWDEASAKRRGHFLVNAVYFLLWGVLIGGTVWVTFRWLLPFVFAFATAAALQRPVRWLTERTRVPRGFLSGMLVVTLVLAVAAAIGGIGWWLWRGAVNLLSNEQAVSGIAERLETAWNTLASWGEQVVARFSPETQRALYTVLDSLPEEGGILGQWLSRAAGAMVRFAAERLPDLLFAFFVWVVASVFLTGDYQRVTAFLQRQLPPERRALATDVRALCGGTLGQLARAYGLLMLITFAELWIGLGWLGVAGAPLIAALIALVDIFPVLGVGTVLIPWAGIAFLNGTPRFGMWLLVLYLVITVVRNLVEPRLISWRVGLPPVVTVLCLYLGFKLGGVVGLLLFPVAVTVLVQLHRRGHITLYRG